MPRFEEIATGTVASQTAQIQEFGVLINQLPSCNRTLLMWLLLHLDAIIKNEKINKMNIQTLAMLLGPTLQMSHRLLVTMLSHCSVLFPGVVLTKWVSLFNYIFQCVQYKIIFETRLDDVLFISNRIARNFSSQTRNEINFHLACLFGLSFDNNKIWLKSILNKRKAQNKQFTINSCNNNNKGNTHTHTANTFKENNNSIYIRNKRKKQ